jgi:hypothetical protein
MQISAHYFLFFQKEEYTEIGQSQTFSILNKSTIKQSEPDSSAVDIVFSEFLWIDQINFSSQGHS